MQSHRLEMVDVGDRYLDGSYSRKNPGWHEADANWKAKQVIIMLERHDLSPSSIYDIGCGTGGALRGLAERFPSARLRGYEPGRPPSGGASAEGVALIDDVDPRQSRERWDLMLMLDVFEHVEDYLGFLRSYASLADRAVFHVPLDLSVQSVLRSRPILGARESVGHLHYFTRETALVTIEEAEYSVIDSFLTHGGIELPGHGWRRRIAALPRRAAAGVSEQWAARILGGFSLLVLAKGRGDGAP